MGHNAQWWDLTGWPDFGPKATAPLWPSCGPSFRKIPGTGQLLRSGRLQKNAGDRFDRGKTWGATEMFKEQQLRSKDPGRCVPA